MSTLDTLKNVVDNNIENYLGMPPIMNDRKHHKVRLGTTTHKESKEHKLKRKHIAEQSRKINRKKGK
jgi:hypothetical protein